VNVESEFKLERIRKLNQNVLKFKEMYINVKNIKKTKKKTKNKKKGYKPFSPRDRMDEWMNRWRDR